MKKVLLLVLFFSATIGTLSAIQHPSDSVKTGDVTINEIFIIGNKKTQPQIIKREMTIKKNTSYAREELGVLTKIDEEKVYNTNLFNEVTIEVLETSSDRIDILVKVDERWYFYPSPTLEIADRNLMDWLINRDGQFNRFNYGLKVDQYNFRGRNEQIRFIGQLGFERQFQLRYSIPYIEKTQRHGLIFDAVYNEREDMAYITQDHLPSYIEADEINRTSWAGSITHSYRPSFYNFHYTTIGYMNGHVSDTIVTLNPNYYGNSRTTQQYFRVAYSYINDRRNVRNFPPGAIMD